MKPSQDSKTSLESSRGRNGELSYDLEISDGCDYVENSQRNSSDEIILNTYIYKFTVKFSSLKTVLSQLHAMRFYQKKSCKYSLKSAQGFIFAKRSSSSSNWEPIETNYKFVGDLTEVEDEVIFVDGSRYKGTWDALGMAGVGRYRMPHDVLYDGRMWDGMQHGQGRLEYPGKQKIDGFWSRGQLQKWRYTFSDGLVYEEENWTYCKFPDRRFNQSKLNGLNPAGRSRRTQHQPTKVIPAGSYDAGDGIFDPSTLHVANFDRPSKVIFFLANIPVLFGCRLF
ncbi:uncharacterized protein LOC124406480 [Diprion similis]|uniref:uncharacterized protein LOC124406480 n=1 Tax=Diprion similis TaxID=362088 RepID=UPI001EF77879|nr:uncharacterized protein LOC124406480 [Diprion similis]